MKYFIQIIIIISVFFSSQGCRSIPIGKSSGQIETRTKILSNKNTESAKSIPARTINTKNIPPDSLVGFSESLLGIKYKYGSATKESGFDCSGFITYVFNHYRITVPRTSIDFTNAGIPIPLDKTKRGDIILFTGTDTTGWVVGHMGIITQNINGKIKFIHSSSGKSIGVIISDLSEYYSTRFVKSIRVFHE